jgi:amino acid transporter
VTALRQPDLRPPPPAPAPSRRYQSVGYRAKRLLLGPALTTAQLVHERVSKRVALAVFSSDPISSTAYATEEILLVLAGATLAGGALATGLALPVALAIVALLALLVVSYRQVVDAYPSAGGAYVVSRDNFGNLTAAVAGAALLIDYVLTVAVSVSSGVAAMSSVWPGQLGPLRVEISVAFVLLLMWGNLRGIREAGRIFAVPTYVYVVAIGAMIVAGVWRLATGGIEPIRYTAGQQGLLHAGGAAGAVTVFLVLRAFASGTTALTGVEAISNGVSAFRAPEAVNAKKTLMVMAAIMGTLFLGITYLAVRLGALPFESGYPTVVSQIARQVLGDGPAFLLVQAATLLILVLAANTAFSGFPLLASFASGDALLPRQLRKRGHRLVYSNGIIALSAVAIFLIVVFKADVHALIPLYAVGVVTSFTLAQAGMTRRHLRVREPGWRSGIAINGIGAVVTAVALVVIVVGKFAEGAWMVVIAIPLLVWLLLRIQRTYGREVAQGAGEPAPGPAQAPPRGDGADRGPGPGRPERAPVRPPAQPADHHRPARGRRPRPRPRAGPALGQGPDPVPSGAGRRPRPEPAGHRRGGGGRAGPPRHRGHRPGPAPPLRRLLAPDPPRPDLGRPDQGPRVNGQRERDLGAVPLQSCNAATPGQVGPDPCGGARSPHGPQERLCHGGAGATATVI